MRAQTSTASKLVTRALIPVDAEASPRTTSDHSNRNEPSLGSGDSLGRYAVIEQIGKGGMGAVYRAFDPQLGREVAVKIVRTGQNGAADEARLRLAREAKAMAQLSHPNVVPVYDVGLAGRELFVAMELIEGTTLRRWIQSRRHSWREVLDVLMDAGRGLAAAHAHGLVHRDFKPTNVLVDEAGRARVMDFGLARASVGPPSDDRSLSDTFESVIDPSSPLASDLTRESRVVGTPLYMAPELFVGSPPDFRTDIFSFCVTLYEALYQQRPYSGADIGALTLEKTNAEVKPAPERARVPRWLHASVLRGLEPEPSHRWPSMDELLGELSRRRRRSGRRRVAIGAAVGALAASAALAVSPSDTSVCSGANAELGAVWNEDARRAVREALLATQVAYASATWTRVEQRLDGYAQAWVGAHDDACEATSLRGEQTEAVLDRRMGCLDRALEKMAAAVEVLSSADAKVVQRAIATTPRTTGLEACSGADAQRPLFDPTDPEIAIEVARLRAALARVEALHHAGNYPDALPLAEAISDTADELGFVPLIAEAKLWLGRIEQAQAEFAPAEQHLTTALFTARGIGHDEVAGDAATDLVFVVGRHLDRHEDGLTWGRHAEAELTRRSTETEGYARLLNNVGNVLTRKGDHAQAIEKFRQALAILQRIGSQSLDMANTHHSMGNAFQEMGQLDEAMAQHRHSLALLEDILGPEHPMVATGINNLGNVFYVMGRFDQALAHYQRGLAMWEVSLGLEHERVALAHMNIGMTLSPLGRGDASLGHYRRALPVLEAVYGREHPDVATALNNTGTALYLAGKTEAAAAHLRRALVIREKALGPNHFMVATTLFNLGNILDEQGDSLDALQLHRRALGIIEGSQGADHPHAAYPLTGIGNVLLHLGRHDEAVAPLRRAVALREATEGDPASLGESSFALARALWRGGDRDAAREASHKARAAYQAAGQAGGEMLESVAEWLAAREPVQG